MNEYVVNVENKIVEVTVTESKPIEVITIERGPTGPRGLQGEIGPQGEQGEIGIQGIQGDVGPKGEKGDKGEDGTMSFEDLTPEQKLSLKGDKGEQGEQGVQGEQGIQGEQGLPGVDGSDANVTNTNVISAIGYIPAKTSDIPDISPLMPISGGNLEDYTEKLTTTTGTINLKLGNVFYINATINTTFSIINAVNSEAHSFTLVIDMAAVKTLTFPASVVWQGGEIPDLTEANKRYYLWFNSIDGGIRWDAGYGGMF